jgi:outer membrane lipoprotein SlyB
VHSGPSERSAVVGIAGAVTGGFVYDFFGHAGVTGFNLGSMVCALIGAIEGSERQRCLDAPAGEEVDYDQYHDDHQEQMNQAAAEMQDESQQPQDKKNHNDRPQ